MENSVQGESSSSSDTFNSTTKWKYDVFLSFTGKDTRLKFVDHLDEAFNRSGIKTFRDDVDLERGGDIKQELFQAIQDSLCAVPIISENYANSTWCLDELQKIFEYGRRVFPIFYDVDPADVRHQRNRFREALAEHEEKFNKNTKKVQNWKNVLFEIGNLSGWDTRGRHEAELIKDIVAKVSTYLHSKLPSYDDNLVGIESRVHDMETILEIGLDDKRGVGIWGMGGVGKTTLARVVYKKISYEFEVCCFIANVRDTLQKEGLVCLQEKLLSDLKIENMKISNQYEGKEMIRKHLSSKKVLLVLDDVDDMSQLENLAKSSDWFGKGSRILITTRDSHVLTLAEVGQRIYEMKAMEKDESIRLFSNEAFKKDHPVEGYWELSRYVVEYAGGLPLALKVLGCYFYMRSKAEWIDALNRMKQVHPHKSILQVLKISYDGLDENEQTIFLDVVLVFKHWQKKKVTQILKSCGLHPTIGIKVLIEKSLLVETKDGRLEMHDLIEELGRYIVLQESPNDVCKRSRLWEFKDIKEVLKNNKGSKAIQVIAMQDNYENQDRIKVHRKAFSKMSRLRLLLLNCPTDAPTGLKKLSGALKFVRWPSFPLEALPFPLDELVHIDMQYSNIKQLWNGVKSMNHLKFIDMSWSPNFTETPDFSNVQSLRHLCLSNCASLVKVHESLGVLKELVEVDLHGCENLNSLPSKLETNYLRKLDLGKCKNVKKLPEFGEDMKKLSYLDASHTAITCLPQSFGSLIGLEYLNLSATGLRYLPIDCFSGLFELVCLSLEGCNWLQSLPRLPPRLIRLQANGCCSMECSLDEQMLNLVTSLDHECRGQIKYVISDDEEEENMSFPHKKDDYPLLWLKNVEPEYLPLRNFLAIMPFEGKIPSWFDPNIKYYGEQRCECVIEVDIPSNFRDSKWSGIVVCLHVYGLFGWIYWSSKAPEDDEYNGWEVTQGRLFLDRDDDVLCIMVLEFNEKTCWQHLRGHNNSLHIKLETDFLIHVLGYGWRVICKEDIQNWCNPSRFNQFTQPQHASPSGVKIPLALVQKVLWGHKVL
ncbi:hypothetical protein QN277_016593 [Acacia crassicarpa]|uniref:TIR domain-containing protein n=1 Tax=Acacia crassicarpa TaxID=499986 RepID=A0AAE1TCA3_9FABA|nr:hypothetical protein QN277_016593 [Acacia crassicarpa]